MLSKSTILKNCKAKNRSNILSKINTKDYEYGEYQLDELFFPEGSEFLEGDWVITVSFSPKKK